MTARLDKSRHNNHEQNPKTTGCPNKNQAPKENIIELAIFIQMLNPLVEIVSRKFGKCSVIS